MYHIVFLCKHVTLPPYKQDRVKVLTNISGLIQTEPEIGLWAECRVCSANAIHDVDKNKSSEILLTSFSIVEKKLHKRIVISYFTKSPLIYGAVADTTSAAFCKFLNLTVYKSTAVPVRQP